MGLYDGIKDVAKVLQQADNVDLYLKLLDLSSQALELQEEVLNLRTENRELRQQADLTERITRHESTFITLKNDELQICYCSRCWDAESKLVQVQCNNETGRFNCINCKNSGIFDDNIHNASVAKDKANLRAYYNRQNLGW